MDDEVAIKVERVSKKYCKSLKRSMLYGVKDIGRNTFGLSSHSDRLRKDEFWAVDDVSFELHRGETLGIIGPNGSGKTTLLKMLNGIFWPDKGKITVKGKVGALIEVGAGFHPLLTGRENIYINGAILGMSKEEMDEKFDDIVEFADIGDFIDTPVKFYSSGMFVRLGFAVAVHCEPDILLVDEVLAVGDAKFRAKCYNKIDSLKSKCTIVFVSHSMPSIGRICDKTLVLDRGRSCFLGDPGHGMGLYRNLCSSDNVACFVNSFEPITKCEIQLNSTELQYGDYLEIIVSLISFESINIFPRIIIFDNTEGVVAEGNAQFNDLPLLPLHRGENRFRILVGDIRLYGGEYLVHVNLHGSNAELLVNGYNCCKFRMTSSNHGEIAYQLQMCYPTTSQKGANKRNS